MKNFTSVSVLGLGYIGLPTALLMANSGIQVSGFDIDQNKVDLLKKGKLFFDEKGLSELFDSVSKKRTFTPTTKLKHSEVYIIAVPTPQKKGSADLKYVLSALELIKPVFEKGDLIIIESTIAPTDCIDVIIPAISQWKKSFLFSHCPERAIPGNTLHEMINNDRIVGGLDDESCKTTTQLYSKFVKGKLFNTDPTTAAACKVMENTYRAVNIALANEFAQVAKALNFDVWEAIELANKHPRVNIHLPGPGVGGHCIPIDPWFFIDPSIKVETLIEKSLKINASMAKKVTEEVVVLAKRHKLVKPKVGLLGYSYKKNVDDSRETPSSALFENLSGYFEVTITDEFIKNKEFFDLETVLKKSDIIILSTDHDEYKSINFAKYPNIVFVYDTRNIFQIKNFESARTKYYRLGVSNE